MLTYIRALLTLVAKKLNSMCAHGSKYIGYMKKKQGQSFENLPILGFFVCFFVLFYHHQDLQQQNFGKKLVNEKK